MTENLDISCAEVVVKLKKANVKITKEQDKQLDSRQSQESSIQNAVEDGMNFMGLFLGIRDIVKTEKPTRGDLIAAIKNYGNMHKISVKYANTPAYQSFEQKMGEFSRL
ncbi:MAG: hypothetical protein Q8L27_01050 [archaeon]|nr:hypothetical protein [archaeon]